MNAVRPGPIKAVPLITLLNLIDGEPWTKDAACRNAPDPDLWFPTARADMAGQIRKAAKVCQTCPVQLQCRDEARSMGEMWGVWGGESFESGRRKRHSDEMKQRRSEVARMTRAGLTAKQIAERLAVDERTIIRDRAAAS